MIAIAFIDSEKATKFEKKNLFWDWLITSKKFVHLFKFLWPSRNICMNFAADNSCLESKFFWFFPELKSITYFLQRVPSGSSMAKSHKVNQYLNKFWWFLEFVIAFSLTASTASNYLGSKHKISSILQQMTVLYQENILLLRS